MTNIFNSQQKVAMKAALFRIGVQTLEKHGWKVERVPGSGKSSVRRITKGGQSKVVSIRTSQDTRIAFPRTAEDKTWRTLDEVEAVVPVSVDDPEQPKAAKVHLIEGDEVRARFNRAYAARKKAGHSIPIGRGVWVSLYLPEAQDPVSHVGAGMGLVFPPLEVVPLSSAEIAVASASAEEDEEVPEPEVPVIEPPLTIPDAKRRLAQTLGVDASKIKIIVEA